MKVLLIVDLQNDFCPGGSLAVTDGDKIVPVINDLLENGGFDLKIASKDWHPANHVSFAASHPGTSVFQVIEVEGGKQILWPVHCPEGSYGAEFHPELRSDLVDKVILKGTNPDVDSYSAFFDNNNILSTGLVEFLTEQVQLRGEKFEDIELTVVGLATDYCVKFSVLDARKLGLKTTLVVDACRAVNASPNDERDSLYEMRQAGVDLAHSREILQPVLERESAMPFFPAELNPEKEVPRPRGIEL